MGEERRKRILYYDPNLVTYRNKAKNLYWKIQDIDIFGAENVDNGKKLLWEEGNFTFVALHTCDKRGALELAEYIRKRDRNLFILAFTGSVNRKEFERVDFPLDDLLLKRGNSLGDNLKNLTSYYYNKLEKIN